MTESDQVIRIIKKYPNRRVYDTEQSKYIKMDDLRQMVVDGTEFKVIDTKTESDVTHSVLLQIILEQESTTNPLFTTENLKYFIRYSNQQYHQFFSEYLSQSLSVFNKQQEHFTKNLQGFSGQNVMEVFTDLSKKNIDMWQSVQQSFFDQFEQKNDTDK